MSDTCVSLTPLHLDDLRVLGFSCVMVGAVLISSSRIEMKFTSVHSSFSGHFYAQQVSD